MSSWNWTAFWRGFGEGLRAALIPAVAGFFYIFGFYCGQTQAYEEIEHAPVNITCYNPELNITYMSVEPVIMANEYGVWKFASGKGAYIQNSGDTCIVEEVNQ